VFGYGYSKFFGGLLSTFGINPRHMALVFVALFFFGAHHPLSRKRREDILDTSETNLELPQQQMPGA